MDPRVRDWLAEIGRRGGQKSRRSLSSETARLMVKVREARRAYRRFHARCFWPFDPDFLVGIDDVQWVADRLKRHGGRDAWLIGSKLCR